MKTRTWLLASALAGGLSFQAHAQRLDNSGAAYQSTGLTWNLIDFGVRNDNTGNQGILISNLLSIGVAFGIKNFHLSGGEYYIDLTQPSTIQFLSNINFYGDGKQKTFIHCADALATGPTWNQCMGSGNISNFTAHDFTVIGDVFTNTVGSGSVMIGINGFQTGNQFTCKNIDFKDVEVTQGRYFGLIVKGCDGVNFTRDDASFMARNGIAAWASSNVTVDGGNFRYVNDDAISCQPNSFGGNGAQLVPPLPNRCIIINTHVSESSGIRVEGDRNFVIANNVLTGDTDHGIIVNIGGTGGNTQNTTAVGTIANNILSDIFNPPGPNPYTSSAGYIRLIGGVKNNLFPYLGPAGTPGILHDDNTTAGSVNPGGGFITVNNNVEMRTRPANSYSFNSTGDVSSGNVLPITSLNTGLFGPLIIGMTVTEIANGCLSTATISAIGATTVTITGSGVTCDIPSGTAFTFSMGTGTYADLGLDPRGLWACQHITGTPGTTDVNCTWETYAINDSLYTLSAIKIAGPLRNTKIQNNVIATHTAAIEFTASTYTPTNMDFDGLDIENNNISECGSTACISYEFSGATYQNIIIKNNLFDNDPENLASIRGLNGTWTTNSGYYCVNMFNVTGVTLEENSYRNCTVTLQGGVNVFRRSDKIYANPVSSPGFFNTNIGVGSIPNAGDNISVIQEDENPNSSTYGEILSNNTTTTAAMPSTGTWVKGTYVTNNTPGACLPSGWTRLTTGSGNVLNTDWAAVTPTVITTWANKPATSGNTGCVIQVSDVGSAESLWIDGGSFWRPLNDGVQLYSIYTNVNVTGSLTETTSCGPIKVPASSMGGTGSLDIIAQWGFNASANAKTERVYFGPNGTNADTLVLSYSDASGTDTNTRQYLSIFNNNATSQNTMKGNFGGPGSGTGFVGSTTVNTAVDNYITLTEQLSSTSAGESITQQFCKITIRP